MSQVIKKFTEGGTPRLYKRGNDDIDFDSFIRSSESGFYNWLDRTDLKDDEKAKVTFAYLDIINRMNADPASFEARLGGGFANDAGITNATDGFDAYGIAAGYLGNTLRKMPVYVKPEVKSDKEKYKRNSKSLNSAAISFVWGDNPDLFVQIDPYDEKTKQRGTSARYKWTIDKLTYIRDHPEEFWSFDSDEDKQHWISKINEGISYLQNNNPNDDWFTLGLLGLNNPDKYYYTGQTLSPTNAELQALQSSAIATNNFEQWISTQHPFYTGNLDSRQLDSTTTGTANSQQLNELVNRINLISKDDIREWIRTYIEDPQLDHTSYSALVNAFGGMSVPLAGLYTKDLIFSIVLVAAIRKGLGKKIGDSNIYYYPITEYDEEDGSTTIYIYDADNYIFKKVDTHTIPDYQQKYIKEYNTANPNSQTNNSAYKQYYPSVYLKKGGVLKAETGASVPNPGTSDIDPNIAAWAALNLGVDFSDPNNKITLDTNVNGFDPSRNLDRTNAIGTIPIDPNIQNAYNWQQKYKLSNVIVNDVNTAYNTWKKLNTNGNVNTFLTWYNDAVSRIRTKSLTKHSTNMGTTGYTDLYNDYNTIYSSSANVSEPDFNKGFLGHEDKLKDIYGPTMYLRNALSFTDDNDFADQRTITLPDGSIVYLNNKGYLEIKSPQSNTPTETASDSASDSANKPRRSLTDILNEIRIRLLGLGVKGNLSKQGFYQNLGMDLLGASRLTGSILSNNKIANVVDQSLNPDLLNTYELFSPVTGAFSTMQLMNNQGANVQFQANQPYTSDGSLMSARMLEGLKTANELQTKGFIADDQEIQKTKNAALERQEGNIARRSKLANDNRSEIIKTNQAKAQLEASRLKKNWTSIDDYMQGVEKRVRERFDENRNMRNKFALLVGVDEAKSFAEHAQQQIRGLYEAYRKNHPDETFSDWINLNYIPYSAAAKTIRNITSAMQNRTYADVYGLDYTWPTYKDELGHDLDLEWNVLSYPWIHRNGGKLIKKQRNK